MIRGFFSGLLILLVLVSGNCFSQDSLAKKNQPTQPDSARGSGNSRDSTRRRYFDSTLFSDNNTLTNSDYLLHIQHVYQVLDKVPAVTGSFEKLDEIGPDLVENDTAVAVIKERLSGNDRSLNLRNLQMFYSLLEAIQHSDRKSSKDLDVYDKELDELKAEVLQLRRDTIFRHIFRDSVLRKSFSPQLKGLREKWARTDTLVRTATNAINQLKAQASSNEIAATELLNQTSTLLARIGPRAFTKERSYLWEPRPNRPGNSAEVYRRAISNENKAVKYYFANTRAKRWSLLLVGFVFFYWVFKNHRILSRLNKLPVLTRFHFKYINPVPIAASLVWMLTLAPLFDLNAPAIYIETTQFLMMLVLTGLFWKRWPPRMFFWWCAIVVLFVLLSLSRILGLPYSLQRWWALFISLGSIAAGFAFKTRVIINANKQNKKLLVFATWIYIVLNGLAVICNLFGRSTLQQIFSYTSIYTFAQVISLTVFVESLEEAFLLQIVASRARKGYPDYFDETPATKGINRAVTVVAVAICFIAITTNLNVYNFIYSQLQDLLSSQHSIGSINFTLGGILLFLGIIWLANFLQRYIAYFFGDIGDDAAFDNKGERSRLMITRLVLLIAGFLLAVAASGLPMDKITVILGALGVGIGLGLQGIVNNFVSGIILIFDRPLRIGDTVEVGDKKGRVKEISIRSSTLLTPEGAEVIIPNGDVLAHNIVNWSLSNNHVRIEQSVTVEGNPNASELTELFRNLLHDNPYVLGQRSPEVLVSYPKGNKAEVIFTCWCNDVSKLDLAKSEISRVVYELLRQKNLQVV